MPNHVIHDLDELETALRQPRLLLLKYSPICVISATARAEWEMFQLDCPDAPTFLVDVINARAISQEIATKFGVEHESPQAILFENSAATWHASHSAISASSLAAAWTADY